MPPLDWNTMLHSASSIANIPFPERVTCTVPEALRVTGLGRTKLYELIGQGSLRTFKIGRRRLIVVESLLALVPSDSTSPAHRA
ncbi:MAG TPA: helix-turn-helix domain-containing protein [Rhizomicrobium sp.]|jgi:excisionase family DNA binding protein|nr:helix-turn-helix domain-containing protein [Rhizomicrobium sp.]